MIQQFKQKKKQKQQKKVKHLLCFLFGVIPKENIKKKKSNTLAFIYFLYGFRNFNINFVALNRLLFNSFSHVSYVSYSVQYNLNHRLIVYKKNLSLKFFFTFSFFFFIFLTKIVIFQKKLK